MSHCYWCAKPKKKLTKDHVVPLALGGRYDGSNTVRACDACNTERGLLTTALVGKRGANVSAALLHKWIAAERVACGGKSPHERLLGHSGHGV